ncbi:hypothetical protein [Deinococcus maricopensis]|uniref:Uncharacterized protein n=1 Tax=Deinococcus maricopensis (strain DSM 21211 / LMG 22137 / NRRL B-23946 / LB-34) TaxID=709986 RepID=E8U7K6_DEIML|nr:hypothetical protein [Deinococcus maricopensis]ADV67045.1 hypothetical protein Deima_1395 [Deinococcus maricopensis DSM 21211]
MTPVDRAELPGMEFDWVAADARGHLAQMQTGGYGGVPDAALSSEELLFELHLLLDEMPVREDLSIPEGTFDAMLADAQRRGLYVYDANEDGTYRRVAAPTQPLTLHDVPERLRGIIPVLPGVFVEREHLSVNT